MTQMMAKSTPPKSAVMNKKPRQLRKKRDFFLEEGDLDFKRERR
jgi:hypothetical protein